MVAPREYLFLIRYKKPAAARLDRLEDSIAAHGETHPHSLGQGFPFAHPGQALCAITGYCPERRAGSRLDADQHRRRIDHPFIY